MVITTATIINIAALLAAFGAIIGMYNKAHNWYLRQEEQSTELSHLKKETNILCECMAACLDGLEQLGANHTVPKAKEHLNEYLRNAAHA